MFIRQILETFDFSRRRARRPRGAPSMPALAGCRNCEADLAPGQAYCATCGQKAVSTRLTLHEIGHDLLHAFVHADRSVLSLVGMLILRPGIIALDYVQGKRKRYFGPFAFLAVVVGLTAAEVALTGFHAVTTPHPNAVADFLQNHINLVFLAQVPLLAAYSRLLDLRGGFTFAEHLILAAYASSMRILLGAVVLIPVWLIFSLQGATANYVYLGYLLICTIYFGFATSQFLATRRALSWCKGILASVLTWVSIQALATLAGRALA
jgi:hypothetical protein